MLTKASKALDIAENILAAIAGFMLLFMTFSVLLEVFSRYFFHHSFLWVNEITEYMMLYIPFFAGAWLIRLNEHIFVDIIDNLPLPRLHAVLPILMALTGIFICLILVINGYKTTMDLYVRNVKSITVLGIPQVYVYLSIPLGSFVMLLEFIRQLTQAVKK